MDGATKQLELDGQLRAFDSEKTFGAIADEIKTELAPSRVVTEIILDGRAVELTEEDALNEQTLKTLGRLELKSRDVYELFRESLKLAPRICEALKHDCSNVEHFFSEGNILLAQERVGEMSSLLEWLLQLISGMQSLGNEKVEEMTFSGGRVMESVDRMQLLLAKLHLNLASQQWEPFRETINGEFKNEVSKWQTLFEEASQSWTPRASNRAS